MKICYCILFTAYCLLLNAQAPDTLWTKTYGGAGGDIGASVQQTFEGGFIICGHTASFGVGEADVYLIKTDSIGDTLWTKTYGGSMSDTGWCVEQTPDSGFIIAGVNYNTFPGTPDMWLLKTDIDGDTMWTKMYGGDGNEYARSVQVTLEGGYIVCGASSSFNPGNDYDVYLVKTDSDGDTVWTKTYGYADDDGGLAVRQTSDYGYIIAGETQNIQTGNWDVYLIKTDSLGDTLWTRIYGKAQDDKAHSVEQTADGGYIITGYTEFAGSGWDIWLFKTDSHGDTLWGKVYGGAGNEVGGAVHQTTDGGFIICGYSNSYATNHDAVFIIRTDSLGTIVWTKVIGGDTTVDRGFSLQFVSDGGYIITGFSMSFDGEPDVYLVRLGKPQGAEEEITKPINYYYGATIFNGPLILPADKKCKVYDITGRTVDATTLAPGVYFVEIEGQITNKVIKVR